MKNVYAIFHEYEPPYASDYSLNFIGVWSSKAKAIEALQEQVIEYKRRAVHVGTKVFDGVPTDQTGLKEGAPYLIQFDLGGREFQNFFVKKTEVQ